MKKISLQLKRQLGVLATFFKVMQVKPYHFIIPICFSFLAVSLGGVGLGLLVPLAKGVAANDYSFINNIPVLGQLVGFVQKPQWDFLTSNRAVFLFLAILIFFATTLKYIFQYLSQTTASYWNGKFSRRIRVFVFKRFLSFGKSYFDCKGQGYVYSVINYSQTVLQLLDFLRSAISSVFDIGVHILILVLISWKLTIFTLFLAPLLHFLLRKIIKEIASLARKTIIEEISLSTSILNILSCIPLIKAYSKEDKMSRVYADSTERLRILKFRSDRLKNAIQPIQGTVTLMALLILVAIVAFILARDKAADLGGFVVFFYVARDLLPKFGIFNATRQTIATLRPPLKEVHQVFYSHDKGAVRQGNREFKGLAHSIELNNLSFSYGGKRLTLKDITTVFKKGEMTAIVGPTGAGKTTLVNLLMRFYNCPLNSIKIDGIDIAEFKIESLRKHISVVSQDDFLFNDTLVNNIIFACDRKPSEEKIIDILRKTQLYDFVSRLPEGLDTRIGDRGIKLSGGEKQRVSVARALLRETEVLILDEATSALDTGTEKLIQQSIEEAIKGRTTIVIAHRLSTIKNANKIIVIEDGMLKEEGPLQKLLAEKGKFYQYWQEQKFF